MATRKSAAKAAPTKKTSATAKSSPSAAKSSTVKVEAPSKTAKMARASKKKPVPNVTKIFQIYYREDQREHMDDAFIPLNNSANTSHLLELDVFRRLAGSNDVAGCAYWGALSWKFFQKTGLRGKDVFGIIETNPGYDCYFCNPSPDTESTFHNLWLQGETAHPNFIKLAKTFFGAVGLDEKLLLALYPSWYFASANYFIANAHFWNEYLAFVGGILQQAEKNLPLPAKQAMYSSLADPRGLHADAGYWPFFVERLFSVFLILRGKEFKIHKFQTMAPNLEKNIHHRLLLQMKDMACKSNNNWLAVCWINYRNLYFSELHGREWVRKHIENITPSKIFFVPPLPEDK